MFSRSKNTVNILIKNMLDGLIGALSYWAIGWALAYGPGSNGFIGESNFFRYCEISLFVIESRTLHTGTCLQIFEIGALLLVLRCFLREPYTNFFVI